MSIFSTIRGHTVFVPSLESNPFVIDLGANRGEFSRQMHDRFGGSYRLIEANPALAEELKSYGVFLTINCAAAAAEGSIDFNVAKNDEGSSILDLPLESTLDCIRVDTVTVPARRLESLMAEFGRTWVDLVKMDIEGAEVQVLQNVTPETLRQIGQITVEFHCDPIFGFGMRREVDALFKRLEGAGFIGIDFSGEARVDVLFVNMRSAAVRPAVRVHLFAMAKLRPPLARLWNG